MVHKPRQQAGALSRGEKPYEPTARDLEIHDAYASGEFSLREVAEKFGYRSHEGVRKVFRKVNEYLVVLRMDRTREMREMVLARNMHRYREAMRAWRRSQEDETTVTITENADRRTADAPARASTQSRDKKTTVKRQVGDPRFLQIAAGCTAEVRAMLGLDAAAKYQDLGSDPDAGRVAGRNRDVVRIEFALRILTDVLPADAVELLKQKLLDTTVDADGGADTI